MFWSLITGKRHWYGVELKYYSKSHVLMFHGTIQIGVASQSQILNSRWLRKHVGPDFIAKFPGLLCNGTLSATPVVYLGKFRKEPGTQKASMWECLFWNYLNWQVSRHD